MIISSKSKIEGFTIVELLVVMTLFGILASLFYFGLSIVQKSSHHIITSYTHEIELNNLMRQINYEFSSADSVFFEEEGLHYYIDNKDGIISTSNNKITWEKGIITESLIVDSISFSVSPNGLKEKVKQIELTIRSGNIDYFFFLENKKQF